MKLSKYIILFAASTALCALALAAFNIAVDPFGVFGDRIFKDYSYNMTQNPRIAKFTYLEQNHEKYNSYIIGSSKTSSYSVEKLNGYTGDSFYNMLMYGGDLYDAQKTAEYVINNYEVKNIILNIGIEEMYKFDYEDDPIKGNLHAKVSGGNVPLFRLKYAFANPVYALQKLEASIRHDYLPDKNHVFVPETGVYDKSLRDAEAISGIEDFEAGNPSFHLYRADNRDGGQADKVCDAIRTVKGLCDSKGISFKLIASPLYDTEIQDYNYEDLCAYWQKLAEITDFYDFSGYSPISTDARYFYDDAHFRNSVGDMALAYIYGDTEAYIPEGFGHITTAENAAQRAREIFAKPDSEAAEHTKKVPVLMYHTFGEETEDNGMIISPERFESQLIAMRQNGYESVTLGDMRDYVTKGIPLPEKPVLITIDDGYRTNYDIAYPLLKKHGFKAVIFAVGVTTGATTYKDSGKQIFPHFTYEEARIMQDSGVIDIQSHTYDMHQVKGIDEPYREGAAKLKGESDTEFARIFEDDILRSKTEIEQNVGNSVYALSYPMGIHSPLTDTVIRKCGYDITFTTQEGTNELIMGLPQSLYNLKRMGMYPNIDAKILIDKLGGN